MRWQMENLIMSRRRDNFQHTARAWGWENAGGEKKENEPDFKEQLH